MRPLIKFVLLSQAIAVATFAFGWWAVPIVAALWAVIASNGSRPVLMATICAVAGWGELLLLNATRGPVLLLAQQLGGILGTGAVGVLAVTLAFGAGLAWSAATLAATLRQRVLPVARAAGDTVGAGVSSRRRSGVSAAEAV